MWLYPEVPVQPRRRPWLWMTIPAAVLVTAVVAVVAVPHESRRVTPGAMAATIQHPDTRDNGGVADRVIRQRADLQARLRALRARTNLTPQRATGIPIPPACLENPLATGCE